MRQRLGVPTVVVSIGFGERRMGPFAVMTLDDFYMNGCTNTPSAILTGLIT